MAHHTNKVKSDEIPLQLKSSVLVAVGSNMRSKSGSPEETILAGIELLVAAGAIIKGQSHFYRTPAFPAGSGPEYVNGALEILVNWSRTRYFSQSSCGRRKVGSQSNYALGTACNRSRFFSHWRCGLS